MDQLIILLTAVIFYFIGYFSGRYYELKTVGKKIKRILNKPVGGVIDYPTAEQVAYNGSEREKIDKQQEILMRNAGIIK